MKRFLFGLLVALPVCALAADKKNISMVTYFPVPYVAYSTVNVDNNMDIGLGSAATLGLGNEDLAETVSPLDVSGFINVKGSSLTLNAGHASFLGVDATNVTLGGDTGEANLTFNRNLRANTIDALGFDSVQTEVKTLNLAGYTFPSCKSANPSSNGYMYWTNMSLTNNASDVATFLTCGKYAKPDTGNCTASREAVSSSGQADNCNGDAINKWTGDICDEQRNKSCVDVYSSTSSLAGFSGVTVPIGMKTGQIRVGATVSGATSQVGGGSSQVVSGETPQVGGGDGYVINQQQNFCYPACKSNELCSCRKTGCECIGVVGPGGGGYQIHPDDYGGKDDPITTTTPASAELVKCVCTTPVITKTCAQWNDASSLTTQCAAGGKVYDSSKNSSKKTASPSECCSTCQEAYGSNYTWNSSSKECEDRSFHETMLSGYVRYKIVPSGEENNPIYTITDTPSQGAMGPFGAGTVMDQFKRGGTEACLLYFLDDKYSENSPGYDYSTKIYPCPTQRSICDSCDVTKDSCSKKCYDADAGWYSFLDYRITANGMASYVPASGTVSAPASNSTAVIYNGNGTQRQTSSGCVYGGCSTQPEKAPSYDIDCSYSGVNGAYYRQSGSRTTSCTWVNCGNGTTSFDDPIYWNSGSSWASPLVYYNHSIKGCTRN